MPMVVAVITFATGGQSKNGFALFRCQVPTVLDQDSSPGNWLYVSWGGGLLCWTFASCFVTPAAGPPNSLFNINPHIADTGYCKDKAAVWHGKCRDAVSSPGALLAGMEYSGPVMIPGTFSFYGRKRTESPHLFCIAFKSSTNLLTTLHRDVLIACTYPLPQLTSDVPS